ncbi:MAG: hypothetical protein ABIJ05_04850, partial [Patescibacteria group bacterium]
MPKNNLGLKLCFSNLKRKVSKGFIDPLSLFSIGFLVISLLVGVYAISKSDVEFDFRNKAVGDPEYSTTDSSPVCGSGLNCSASELSGGSKCKQTSTSTTSIYCCGSGYIIVGSVCKLPDTDTSSLPICGTGLNCSSSRLDGGTHCKQSSSSTSGIYCCPSGKEISGSSCITPTNENETSKPQYPICGSGLNCSSSSLSGATTCVQSGSTTPIYCCPSGENFSEGTCKSSVPIIAKICSYGEKRCSGNNIQSCSSDGSKWITETSCGTIGCDPSTGSCNQNLKIGDVSSPLQTDTIYSDPEKLGCSPCNCDGISSCPYGSQIKCTPPSSCDKTSRPELSSAPVKVSSPPSGCSPCSCFGISTCPGGRVVSCEPASSCKNDSIGSETVEQKVPTIGAGTDVSNPILTLIFNYLIPTEEVIPWQLKLASLFTKKSKNEEEVKNEENNKVSNWSNTGDWLKNIFSNDENKLVTPGEIKIIQSPEEIKDPTCDVSCANNDCVPTIYGGYCKSPLSLLTLQKEVEEVIEDTKLVVIKETKEESFDIGTLNDGKKWCSGNYKPGQVVIWGGYIQGCKGGSGSEDGEWINLSAEGYGPEVLTIVPSWLTTDSKTYQTLEGLASEAPKYVDKNGVFTEPAKELWCNTDSGGVPSGTVSLGGVGTRSKCKNKEWIACSDNPDDINNYCVLTIVPSYIKNDKNLMNGLEEEQKIYQENLSNYFDLYQRKYSECSSGGGKDCFNEASNALSTNGLKVDVVNLIRDEFTSQLAINYVYPAALAKYKDCIAIKDASECLNEKANLNKTVATANIEDIQIAETKNNYIADEYEKMVQNYVDLKFKVAGCSDIVGSGSIFVTGCKSLLNEISKIEKDPLFVYLEARDKMKNCRSITVCQYWSEKIAKMEEDPVFADTSSLDFLANNYLSPSQIFKSISEENSINNKAIEAIVLNDTAALKEACLMANDSNLTKCTGSKLSEYKNSVLDKYPEQRKLIENSQEMHALFGQNIEKQLTVVPYSNCNEIYKNNTRYPSLASSGCSKGYSCLSGYCKPDKGTIVGKAVLTKSEEGSLLAEITLKQNSCNGTLSGSMYDRATNLCVLQTKTVPKVTSLGREVITSTFCTTSEYYSGGNCYLKDQKDAYDLYFGADGYGRFVEKYDNKLANCKDTAIASGGTACKGETYSFTKFAQNSLIKETLSLEFNPINKNDWYDDNTSSLFNFAKAVALKELKGEVNFSNYYISGLGVLDDEKLIEEGILKKVEEKAWEYLKDNVRNNPDKRNWSSIYLGSYLKAEDIAVNSSYLEKYCLENNLNFEDYISYEIFPKDWTDSIVNPDNPKYIFDQVYGNGRNSVSSALSRNGIEFDSSVPYSQWVGNDIEKETLFSLASDKSFEYAKVVDENFGYRLATTGETVLAMGIGIVSSVVKPTSPQGFIVGTAMEVVGDLILHGFVDWVTLDVNERFVEAVNKDSSLSKDTVARINSAQTGSKLSEYGTMVVFDILANMGGEYLGKVMSGKVIGEALNYKVLYAIGDKVDIDTVAKFGDDFWEGGSKLLVRSGLDDQIVEISSKRQLTDILSKNYTDWTIADKVVQGNASNLISDAASVNKLHLFESYSEKSIVQNISKSLDVSQRAIFEEIPDVSKILSDPGKSLYKTFVDNRNALTNPIEVKVTSELGENLKVRSEDVFTLKNGSILDQKVALGDGSVISVIKGSKIQFSGSALEYADALSSGRLIISSGDAVEVAVRGVVRRKGEEIGASLMQNFSPIDSVNYKTFARLSNGDKVLVETVGNNIFVKEADPGDVIQIVKDGKLTKGIVGNINNQVSDLKGFSSFAVNIQKGLRLSSGVDIDTGSFKVGNWIKNGVLADNAPLGKLATQLDSLRFGGRLVGESDDILLSTTKKVQIHVGGELYDLPVGKNIIILDADNKVLYITKVQDGSYIPGKYLKEGNLIHLAGGDFVENAFKVDDINPSFGKTLSLTIDDSLVRAKRNVTFSEFVDEIFQKGEKQAVINEYGVLSKYKAKDLFEYDYVTDASGNITGVKGAKVNIGENVDPQHVKIIQDRLKNMNVEKSVDNFLVKYDAVMRASGKSKPIVRIELTDGTILSKTASQTDSGFAYQIAKDRLDDPSKFVNAKIVEWDVKNLKEIEGSFFNWRATGTDSIQPDVILESALLPGAKVVGAPTGLGKTMIVIENIAFLKKELLGADTKITVILKNKDDLDAFTNVFNDEAASFLGFKSYKMVDVPPKEADRALIKAANFYVGTSDTIFNSLDDSGMGRELIKALEGSILIGDEAHISLRTDVDFIRSTGGNLVIEPSRSKRFQDLFDPDNGVLGYLTKNHIDDLNQKISSSQIVDIKKDGRVIGKGFSKDIREGAYLRIVNSRLDDFSDVADLRRILTSETDLVDGLDSFINQVGGNIDKRTAEAIKALSKDVSAFNSAEKVFAGIPNNDFGFQINAKTFMNEDGTFEKIGAIVPKETNKFTGRQYSLADDEIAYQYLGRKFLGEPVDDIGSLKLFVTPDAIETNYGRFLKETFNLDESLVLTATPKKIQNQWLSRFGISSNLYGTTAEEIPDRAMQALKNNFTSLKNINDEELSTALDVGDDVPRVGVIGANKIDNKDIVEKLVQKSHLDGRDIVIIQGDGKVVLYKVGGGQVELDGSYLFKNSKVSEGLRGVEELQSLYKNTGEKPLDIVYELGRNYGTDLDTLGESKFFTFFDSTSDLTDFMQTIGRDRCNGGCRDLAIMYFGDGDNISSNTFSYLIKENEEMNLAKIAVSDIDGEIKNSGYRFIQKLQDLDNQRGLGGLFGKENNFDDIYKRWKETADLNTTVKLDGITPEEYISQQTNRLQGFINSLNEDSSFRNGLSKKARDFLFDSSGDLTDSSKIMFLSSDSVKTNINPLSNSTNAKELVNNIGESFYKTDFPEYIAGKNLSSGQVKVMADVQEQAQQIVAQKETTKNIATIVKESTEKLTTSLKTMGNSAVDILKPKNILSGIVNGLKVVVRPVTNLFQSKEIKVDDGVKPVAKDNVEVIDKTTTDTKKVGTKITSNFQNLPTAKEVGEGLKVAVDLTGKIISSAYTSVKNIVPQRQLDKVAEDAKEGGILEKADKKEEIVNEEPVIIEVGKETKSIGRSLSSEEIKDLQQKRDSEKEPQMMRDYLANKDFQPEKVVELGVYKFFVPKFKFDGSDYLEAVLYVEDPSGKLSPRYFYKSNSDGVWRATPGWRSDGKISKGLGIHYTQETKPDDLLVEVIEALETKKNTKRLIPSVGNLDDGGYYSYVDEIDVFDDGRLLEGVQQYPPGYPDFSKGEPNKSTFSNFKYPSGFVPDFSKNPIKKISLEHSLLGPITLETYPAKLNGKNINWVMAYDSIGRVWIERIYSVDSGINSYGIAKEVINSGALTNKPLEYIRQVDTNVLEEFKDYVKYPDSNYLDITLLIDNLEPIKQYRQERNIVRRTERSAIAYSREINSTGLVNIYRDNKGSIVAISNNSSTEAVSLYFSGKNVNVDGTYIVKESDRITIEDQVYVVSKDDEVVTFHRILGSSDTFDGKNIQQLKNPILLKVKEVSGIVPLSENGKVLAATVEEIKENKVVETKEKIVQETLDKPVVVKVKDGTTELKIQVPDIKKWWNSEKTKENVKKIVTPFYSFMQKKEGFFFKNLNSTPKQFRWYVTRLFTPVLNTFLIPYDMFRLGVNKLATRLDIQILRSDVPTKEIKKIEVIEDESKSVKETSDDSAKVEVKDGTTKLKTQIPEVNESVKKIVTPIFNFIQKKDGFFFKNLNSTPKQFRWWVTRLFFGQVLAPYDMFRLAINRYAIKHNIQAPVSINTDDTANQVDPYEDTVELSQEEQLLLLPAPGQTTVPTNSLIIQQQKKLQVVLDDIERQAEERRNLESRIAKILENIRIKAKYRNILNIIPPLEYLWTFNNINQSVKLLTAPAQDKYLEALKDSEELLKDANLKLEEIRLAQYEGYLEEIETLEQAQVNDKQLQKYLDAVEKIVEARRILENFAKENPVVNKILYEAPKLLPASQEYYNAIERANKEAIEKAQKAREVVQKEFNDLKDQILKISEDSIKAPFSLPKDIIDLATESIEAINAQIKVYLADIEKTQEERRILEEVEKEVSEEISLDWQNLWLGKYSQFGTNNEEIIRQTLSDFDYPEEKIDRAISKVTARAYEYIKTEVKGYLEKQKRYPLEEKVILDQKVVNFKDLGTKEVNVSQILDAPSIGNWGSVKRSGTEEFFGKYSWEKFFKFIQDMKDQKFDFEKSSFSVSLRHLGGGVYVVVDGTHRVAAAKAAGIKTIKAKVVEAKDSKVLQEPWNYIVNREEWGAIGESRDLIEDARRYVSSLPEYEAVKGEKPIYRSSLGSIKIYLENLDQEIQYSKNYNLRFVDKVRLQKGFEEIYSILGNPNYDIEEVFAVLRRFGTQLDFQSTKERLRSLFNTYTEYLDRDQMTAGEIKYEVKSRLITIFEDSYYNSEDIYNYLSSRFIDRRTLEESIILGPNASRGINTNEAEEFLETVILKELEKIQNTIPEEIDEIIVQLNVEYENEIENIKIEEKIKGDKRLQETNEEISILGDAVNKLISSKIELLYQKLSDEKDLLSIEDARREIARYVEKTIYTNKQDGYFREEAKRYFSRLDIFEGNSELIDAYSKIVEEAIVGSIDKFIASQLSPDYLSFNYVADEESKGVRIAVGDVHGDWNGLVRLLSGQDKNKQGKVISVPLLDKNGKWIGGEHDRLILTGDMFDRAPNGVLSSKVAEKLMNLQKEAGNLPNGQPRIKILLGNHDANAILAYWRMVDQVRNGMKVQDAAQVVAAGMEMRPSISAEDLFYLYQHSEVANWVMNLPPIFIYGKNIYMHSDNSRYLQYGKNLDQIETNIQRLLNNPGLKIKVVGLDGLTREKTLITLISDLTKRGELDSSVVNIYLKVFKGTKIIHGHSQGETPIDSRVINVDGGLSEGYAKKLGSNRGRFYEYEGYGRTMLEIKRLHDNPATPKIYVESVEVDVSQTQPEEKIVEKTTQESTNKFTSRVIQAGKTVIRVLFTGSVLGGLLTFLFGLNLLSAPNVDLLTIQEPVPVVEQVQRQNLEESIQLEDVQESLQKEESLQIIPGSKIKASLFDMGSVRSVKYGESGKTNQNLVTSGDPYYKHTNHQSFYQAIQNSDISCKASNECELVLERISPVGGTPEEVGSVIRYSENYAPNNLSTDFIDIVGTKLVAPESALPDSKILMPKEVIDQIVQANILLKNKGLDIQIAVVSGYRSYQDQVEYNYKSANLTSAAEAGYSQHQGGYGFDATLVDSNGNNLGFSAVRDKEVLEILNSLGIVHPRPDDSQHLFALDANTGISGFTQNLIDQGIDVNNYENTVRALLLAQQTYEYLLSEDVNNFLVADKVVYTEPVGITYASFMNASIIPFLNAQMFENLTNRLIYSKWPEARERGILPVLYDGIKKFIEEKINKNKIIPLTGGGVEDEVVLEESEINEISEILKRIENTSESIYDLGFVVNGKPILYREMEELNNLIQSFEKLDQKDVTQKQLYDLIQKLRNVYVRSLDRVQRNEEANSAPGSDFYLTDDREILNIINGEINKLNQVYGDAIEGEILPVTGQNNIKPEVIASALLNTNLDQTVIDKYYQEQQSFYISKFGGFTEGYITRFENTDYKRSDLYTKKSFSKTVAITKMKLLGILHPEEYINVFEERGYLGYFDMSKTKFIQNIKSVTPEKISLAIDRWNKLGFGNHNLIRLFEDKENFQNILRISDIDNIILDKGLKELNTYYFLNESSKYYDGLIEHSGNIFNSRADLFFNILKQGEIDKDFINKLEFVNKLILLTGSPFTEDDDREYFADYFYHINDLLDRDLIKGYQSSLFEKIYYLDLTADDIKQILPVIEKMFIRYKNNEITQSNYIWLTKKTFDFLKKNMLEEVSLLIDMNNSEDLSRLYSQQDPWIRDYFDLAKNKSDFEFMRMFLATIDINYYDIGPEKFGENFVKREEISKILDLISFKPIQESENFEEFYKKLFTLDRDQNININFEAINEFIKLIVIKEEYSDNEKMLLELMSGKIVGDDSSLNKDDLDMWVYFSNNIDEISKYFYKYKGESINYSPNNNLLNLLIKKDFGLRFLMKEILGHLEFMYRRDDADREKYIKLGNLDKVDDDILWRFLIDKAKTREISGDYIGRYSNLLDYLDHKKYDFPKNLKLNFNASTNVLIDFLKNYDVLLENTDDKGNIDLQVLLDKIPEFYKDIEFSRSLITDQSINKLPENNRRFWRIIKKFLDNTETSDLTKNICSFLIENQNRIDILFDNDYPNSLFFEEFFKSLGSNNFSIGEIFEDTSGELFNALPQKEKDFWKLSYYVKDSGKLDFLFGNKGGIISLLEGNDLPQEPSERSREILLRFLTSTEDISTKKEIVLLFGELQIPNSGEDLIKYIEYWELFAEVNPFSFVMGGNSDVINMLLEKDPFFWKIYKNFMDIIRKNNLAIPVPTFQFLLQKRNEIKNLFTGVNPNSRFFEEYYRNFNSDGGYFSEDFFSNLAQDEKDYWALFFHIKGRSNYDFLLDNFDNIKDLDKSNLPEDSKERSKEMLLRFLTSTEDTASKKIILNLIYVHFEVPIAGNDSVRFIEFWKLLAQMESGKFVEKASRELWKTVFGEEVVNNLLDSLPKSKLADEKRNAFTHNSYDRTSNFLRNLSIYNSVSTFKLTTQDLEIVSKFIGEFGLSNTPKLYYFYKSFYLYENKMVELLPEDVINSGIKTSSELIGKLRLLEELVFSEEKFVDFSSLTDFEVEILSAVTGKSAHRYDSGRKGMRSIMDDFEQDYTQGEISSLPQGYNSKEITIFDVVSDNEIQDIEDYLTIREEILLSIDNANIGDIQELRKDAEEIINDKIQELDISLRSNSSAQDYIRKQINDYLIKLKQIKEVQSIDKLMEILITINFGNKTDFQQQLNSIFRQLVFKKVFIYHTSPGFVEEVKSVLTEKPNVSSLTMVINILRNQIKDHAINVQINNAENYWIKEAFEAIKNNKKRNNLNDIFGGYLEHFESDLNETVFIESDRSNIIMIIPDRGFIGEMSAYLANVCYSKEYPLLKRFPEVVPFKFIREEAEGLHSFVGSVLVFERKDADGNPIMIIRAFDVPKEEEIDIAKLFDEFVKHLKSIAKTRGIKKILVAGTSSTISNYPIITNYVLNKYVHGKSSIQIEGIFDFNEYDITNSLFLVSDLSINNIEAVSKNSITDKLANALEEIDDLDCNNQAYFVKNVSAASDVSSNCSTTEKVIQKLVNKDMINWIREEGWQNYSGKLIRFLNSETLDISVTQNGLGRELGFYYFKFTGNQLFGNTEAFDPSTEIQNLWNTKPNS